MGEPNNVLKVYMKRPDRIRSVLEYFLGRKLPQDWAVETKDGFYTVQNSKGKVSFRERDIMTRIRTKEFSFCLGLENQDAVNLIYPWRVMELDCRSYGEGIEEIQERNEAAKTVYRTGDDFKYRYKEEDRLEPVLTLTLYWGRKRWNRPLSLNDMTDIAKLPKELQEKFVDYRVNLIHMRSIPDEALQEMDSDLKYVLGLMKRTGSKKAYGEYIRHNREYFSRIPRSAVDVINVCTNIKNMEKYLYFTKSQEDGEETADMCRALVEIEKDAEKRGVRKGVRKGVQQGIDRTRRLTQLLLADGRQDDLVRSTTDAVFMKKLFKEYGV